MLFERGGTKGALLQHWEAAPVWGGLSRGLSITGEACPAWGMTDMEHPVEHPPVTELH